MSNTLKSIQVTTTFSNSVFRSRAFLTLQERLYCICNRPRMQNKQMVKCTECSELYHLDCIGLTPAKLNRIRTYVCAKCEPLTSLKGPDVKSKTKPKSETQTQKSKERCLNCKKKICKTWIVVLYT